MLAQAQPPFSQKLPAMTPIQKALAAAAAVVVLICGTAVCRYQRLPKTLDPAAASLKRGAPDRALSRKTEALTELLARTKATKSTVDRRKELERLKLKWLELGGGNQRIPEQEALAKERAELLMCTRETLELLKFLNERKIEFANMKLESAVEALFRSSHAAEARKLLTELPEAATLARDRGYTNGGRDRWSFIAGQTCPPGEFDAFLTDLNCQSCAQEALYGRNVELAKTNPMAALESSLNAFNSDVPSISGQSAILRLLEAEIPTEFDWGAAEELCDKGARMHLAAEGSYEDPPITKIREKLFWKWGRIDPAAAANHLMEHPDRLPPELMHEIVGSYFAKYLFDNKQADISFISQLPGGPYYDQAAFTAAIFVRGQHGVYDLIEKIQDPELKQKAIERAKIPFNGIETR
jgi:hypothetical protein